MVTSTALRNFSTSNDPSSRRNFMRFREARLQAVSSRNIYSLQGFDELIGAVLEQVCQLLMVVLYCIPGSPQIQAASAIWRMRSRALYLSTCFPVVTALVTHSLSSRTAFMNSSVTR